MQDDLSVSGQILVDDRSDSHNDTSDGYAVTAGSGRSGSRSSTDANPGSILEPFSDQLPPAPLEQPASTGTEHWTHPPDEPRPFRPELFGDIKG